ncbi:MAG: hypothetical protein EXR65_01095 [Dehalococcoidia bacterium]|nr:hypothetical protein [Dehalococcoidia bacterium]
MTNHDGPGDEHDPLSMAGRELPLLDPPQRVSGMRVPAAWTLPERPEGLSPAAADAWRQSGFLLAADLRLLAQSLDLQLRMAATGYTPRARTMAMAAYASLWSRAFSSLADAAPLVRQGSYQSALPLLRQAVELVAAQAGLVADLDLFKTWAHRAYARDPASRAEEVGLGRYFSGESIAGDEQLRLIYRAASDLGRPNFGPTALFVAADATHERYPLIFADQAFHLGWAQLLLGWQLRIGVAQLHVAMHAPQHFPALQPLRDEVTAHAVAVDGSLADPARCAVQEHTDGDGRRRHLLVGFRRRPADAAKRLLL